MSVPPDVVLPELGNGYANTTIGGVEYFFDPDVGAVPLVADMSSNLLSRPVDVAKYGLIYGGAQKNLAPAGVEIEKAFLGHRRRICLWSLQDHLIDPRIMPRTWALTVGLARTTHFLQKPLGKSERHLL